MGTTKGTQNELKSLISGTYRLKTEERRRTNKGWQKISTKSPTEMSQTSYGSASARIFFMEMIFLTNFKASSDTRRVERFCSSLLPLFIGKRGRSLPPSSPRRAKLLPPEATTFWRKNLEGPSGPGCYLHPFFTKYTPFAFFVILFPKLDINMVSFAYQRN